MYNFCQRHRLREKKESCAYPDCDAGPSGGKLFIRSRVESFCVSSKQTTASDSHGGLLSSPVRAHQAKREAVWMLFGRGDCTRLVQYKHHNKRVTLTNPQRYPHTSSHLRYRRDPVILCLQCRKATCRGAVSLCGIKEKLQIAGFWACSLGSGRLQAQPGWI